MSFGEAQQYDNLVEQQQTRAENEKSFNEDFWNDISALDEDKNFEKNNFTDKAISLLWENYDWSWDIWPAFENAKEELLKGKFEQLSTEEQEKLSEVLNETLEVWWDMDLASAVEALSILMEWVDTVIWSYSVWRRQQEKSKETKKWNDKLSKLKKWLNKVNEVCEARLEQRHKSIMERVESIREAEKWDPEKPIDFSNWPEENSSSNSSWNSVGGWTSSSSSAKWWWWWSTTKV